MNTEKEIEEEILERLAELEHEQFIKLSQIVAPELTNKERLERWKILWKPYKELTEEQKETPRFYAQKVIKYLKEIAFREEEKDKPLPKKLRT